MNRHEIHLQSAIALARKVDHDNCWHLAAIAAKGHRIISYGWNSYKTSPKSNAPFFRIHAEVDCIFSSNNSEHLVGSTMYVARVGYDGRVEVLLSSPCKWCRAMIYKSGIRRVFFTIDRNHYGCWDVLNNTETTHFIESWE